MTRTLITALGIAVALSTTAAAQTKDRFHHPAISAKVNYDSLFAEAIDLSQSGRGQEVVQKCIEHYGGKDQLDQLRSLRLTYTMLLTVEMDTTTTVKSYAEGRRYKVSRKRAAAFEERMLSGDSAWFAGRDTAFAMEKTRYCAELFSYLTLTLPRTLYAEPFSEMRYGTREGDSLEYIYCRKNDSLTMVVGINPGDFTIVSSEGIIHADSNRVIFVNKFSDFQRHGEYLFPGQLINISMGLEVGRSRLTSVEVNPALTEDDFRPARQTTKESPH